MCPKCGSGISTESLNHDKETGELLSVDHRCCDCGHEWTEFGPFD